MFVNNIPIKLSKKEILKYLGYKPLKSQFPPEIENLVENIMQDALVFFETKGIYRTLQVNEVLRDKVTFKNSQFQLSGTKISAFFSKCSYITFMAGTIGEDIEEEIKKLFQRGEAAKAVVFDAVASDAVEQLVEWMDKLVEKYALKSGFDTLRRVSPGYGVWDISANLEIIELLETSKIDISISESYQLFPRKSVIAAKGWFVDRKT